MIIEMVTINICIYLPTYLPNLIAFVWRVVAIIVVLPCTTIQLPLTIPTLLPPYHSQYYNATTTILVLETVA